MDKGELLVGSNFSSQFIDWGHGALGPEEEPHEGTLDSYIGDLNINYGLTEKWNLGMNMVIGKRTMHFPQLDSPHHRDESRSGIGDLSIDLRYLSSNISFGPGTRLFFGGGIIIPSNNTLKSDPFEAGREIPPLDHTHFDMSEGAFKLVGEIQYFKRDTLPIVKGGILKYSSALTENDYSFMPGYQLDAVAMFYWQTKQIFKGIPQFSLIGQKRGVDYWDGDVVPNSGGFILQGAAGLMWILDSHHFTVSFRKPIYQKLNMVQEESSIENHADMWGFSFSYRTVLSFGDK
ncbi:MAG TPA: hypothetical protein EYO24_04675 [Candidatus Marinimicrobia bacterium]|nr:hypothetical protein [Candidatus Neomarinimicrobiota bacterium]HIB52728.1 hypothetical protein [Candidatus Neomarinimicrobiota bacterium]